MLIEIKQEAITLLREHGFKCTKGRFAILELMTERDCAVSGLEIAEELGKKLNRSSVYRALDDFVSSGLVHIAFSKDGINYFELDHNCGEFRCHPHFNCLKCGKTFCLTEKLPKLISVPEGFKITRQKVLIEGICQDCSKKS